MKRDFVADRETLSETNFFIRMNSNLMTKQTQQTEDYGKSL